MNVDAENVPQVITSLSGLPHSKSLLFHPCLAEEAEKLLHLRDDKLVEQLIPMLLLTSSDEIELKEENKVTLGQQQQPELLRAILERNPHVFDGNKMNPSISSTNITEGSSSGSTNTAEMEEYQLPFEVLQSPSQSSAMTEENTAIPSLLQQHLQQLHQYQQLSKAQKEMLIKQQRNFFSGTADETVTRNYEVGTENNESMSANYNNSQNFNYNMPNQRQYQSADQVNFDLSIDEDVENGAVSEAQILTYPDVIPDTPEEPPKRKPKKFSSSMIVNQSDDQLFDHQSDDQRFDRAQVEQNQRNQTSSGKRQIEKNRRRSNKLNVITQSSYRSENKSLSAKEKNKKESNLSRIKERDKSYSVLKNDSASETVTSSETKRKSLTYEEKHHKIKSDFSHSKDKHKKYSSAQKSALETVTACDTNGKSMSSGGKLKNRGSDSHFKEKKSSSARNNDNAMETVTASDTNRKIMPSGEKHQKRESDSHFKEMNKKYSSAQRNDSAMETVIASDTNRKFMTSGEKHQKRESDSHFTEMNKKYSSAQMNDTASDTNRKFMPSGEKHQKRESDSHFKEMNKKSSSARNNDTALETVTASSDTFRKSVTGGEKHQKTESDMLHSKEENKKSSTVQNNDSAMETVTAYSDTNRKSMTSEEKHQKRTSDFSLKESSSIQKKDSTLKSDSAKNDSALKSASAQNNDSALKSDSAKNNDSVLKFDSAKNNDSALKSDSGQKNNALKSDCDILSTLETVIISSEEEQGANESSPEEPKLFKLKLKDPRELMKRHIVSEDDASETVIHSTKKRMGFFASTDVDETSAIAQIPSKANNTSTDPDKASRSLNYSANKRKRILESTDEDESSVEEQIPSKAIDLDHDYESDTIIYSTNKKNRYIESTDEDETSAKVDIVPDLNPFETEILSSVNNKNTVKSTEENETSRKGLSHAKSTEENENEETPRKGLSENKITLDMVDTSSSICKKKAKMIHIMSSDKKKTTVAKKARQFQEHVTGDEDNDVETCIKRTNLPIVARKSYISHGDENLFDNVLSDKMEAVESKSHPEIKSNKMRRKSFIPYGNDKVWSQEFQCDVISKIVETKSHPERKTDKMYRKSFVPYTNDRLSSELIDDAIFDNPKTKSHLERKFDKKYWKSLFYGNENPSEELLDNVVSVRAETVESKSLPERKSEKRCRKSLYEYEKPSNELSPNLTLPDRPKTVKSHPERESDEETKGHSSHKFSEVIDCLLGKMNNLINDLNANDISDNDFVADPDLLLSPKQFYELYKQAKVYKALGGKEYITTKILVQFFNVLEINIRSAPRTSLIPEPNDNEAVRKLWIEAVDDRVIGAAYSSLICLYIITSPNLPKCVNFEDIVDRIALFVNFHLHNTIFGIDAKRIKLTTKWRLDAKKYIAGDKILLSLYSKTHEIVCLLSELLDNQIMTDCTILHVVTMAVPSFFAENIDELQLACLKLVTTIFFRYEKHRRLIMDEIISATTRFRDGKYNYRTYTLTNEKCIHMLTAVILQLIHCVIWPKKIAETEPIASTSKSNPYPTDKDLMTKYDTAIKIAITFLGAFLSKCDWKKGNDCKLLFEIFIQDLLTVLNKPVFPAAVQILDSLGCMLIKVFLKNDNELSLRLAALEYLGIITTQLCKNSVVLARKMNIIDEIVQDIKREEMEDEIEEESEERIGFLKQVLLDYLTVLGYDDAVFSDARHFYIAQWQSDAEKEKKYTKKPQKWKSEGKGREKKNRRKAESDEDEVFIRKKYSKLFSLERAVSETRAKILKKYLDDDKAQLICQYLTSKRSHVQGFNDYLRKITYALRDVSSPIRNKAIKCLTMIVKTDSTVMRKVDVQFAIEHLFLDSSAQVREASVDLLGKFVINSLELIEKYYDKFSARILDTSVSVRKRVIRIFKEICIKHPDFPKISEICVKILRRINDEDVTRKLVIEVFHSLWFIPLYKKYSDKSALMKTVERMIDVVVESHGFLECFELLLQNLFKPSNSAFSITFKVESSEIFMSSCEQIVDYLIEYVLDRRDYIKVGNQDEQFQRLVASFTTLNLFAKVRPQILVKHIKELQSYLHVISQTKSDNIINNLIQTLELVVPLMTVTDKTLLDQLEKDCIQFISNHDRSVITSCLSCLGTVVNNMTKNFQIVRECFKVHYEFVMKYKNMLQNYPLNPFVAKGKPVFNRAVFTISLFLRHFDFTDKKILDDLPLDLKDQIFNALLSFIEHKDQLIQTNILKAIGFICIRHHNFMLEDNLKKFYQKILAQEDVSKFQMKLEVLTNIKMYLIEEDKRMMKLDKNWAERSKDECLKEMDKTSGVASTIIQQYLLEILKSCLHREILVRHEAVRVIQLILQQGLVNPVLIIPYLICLSTDIESSISHTAEKLLTEIEKKYPGYIHSKAQLGITLSYNLQRIIHSHEIVRGFTIRGEEHPVALNGHMYCFLKAYKDQRRAFVRHILQQFEDDVQPSLSIKLYLADNLAHFPYTVLDEPLYILHHIDIMLSLTGTHLLQCFREGLLPKTDEWQMDISSSFEENEDESSLLARMPSNTKHLQACMTSAQNCLLLLEVRKHLKDMYGLTDGKVRQYSRTETKQFEKSLVCQNNKQFNPIVTLDRLKKGDPPEELNEKGKKDLIVQYLAFKQTMMDLDPDYKDGETTTPVSTNKKAKNSGRKNFGILKKTQYYEDDEARTSKSTNERDSTSKRNSTSSGRKYSYNLNEPSDYEDEASTSKSTSKTDLRSKGNSTSKRNSTSSGRKYSNNLNEPSDYEDDEASASKSTSKTDLRSKGNSTSKRNSTSSGRKYSDNLNEPSDYEDEASASKSTSNRNSTSKRNSTSFGRKYSDNLNEPLDYEDDETSTSNSRSKRNSTRSSLKVSYNLSEPSDYEDDEAITSTSTIKRNSTSTSRKDSVFLNEPLDYEDGEGSTYVFTGKNSKSSGRKDSDIFKEPPNKVPKLEKSAEKGKQKYRNALEKTPDKKYSLKTPTKGCDYFLK